MNFRFLNSKLIYINNHMSKSIWYIFGIITFKHLLMSQILIRGTSQLLFESSQCFSTPLCLFPRDNKTTKMKIRLRSHKSRQSIRSNCTSCLLCKNLEGGGLFVFTSISVLCGFENVFK